MPNLKKNSFCLTESKMTGIRKACSRQIFCKGWPRAQCNGLINDSLSGLLIGEFPSSVICKNVLVPIYLI